MGCQVLQKLGMAHCSLCVIAVRVDDLDVSQRMVIHTNVD